MKTALERGPSPWIEISRKSGGMISLCEVVSYVKSGQINSCFSLYVWPSVVFHFT